MSSGRADLTLTLPAHLLEDARALGLDIGALTETALRDAVVQARRAGFYAENRAAISEYNERIEREGPSLQRYRTF
jgi:antitoxin CcdA